MKKFKLMLMEKPKLMITGIGMLIIALIVGNSIIFSGSNVTKEEALEQAQEIFKDFPVESKVEPNNETELFSFYLPSSLSVEETTATTVLLSEEEQLYLLFSNPEESDQSKVNYEIDVLQEKDLILVEELSTDEHFAYIMISSLDKETYEVIVGRGGDKVTTIATMEDIPKSVTNTIELLSSITYE